MRLVLGKVVDGRIDPQGDPPLEEGSVVTILAREADGTFELDAHAEAKLLEAVAEADRGDLVDAEELLRSLRSGG
jgi:hypothetical protein